VTPELVDRLVDASAGALQSILAAHNVAAPSATLIAESAHALAAHIRALVEPHLVAVTVAPNATASVVIHGQ
jgi:hypothetical protein